MKFTRRDWCWLAVCGVLALAAMASETERNRLLHQANNLKVFEITVEAVDQVTGRPTEDLTIAVKPKAGPGQVMKLWSSSACAPNAIQQEFIGTPPFTGEVSVGSKGYQQKTVRFDEESKRLSVSLTRKPK